MVKGRLGASSSKAALRDELSGGCASEPRRTGMEGSGAAQLAMETNDDGSTGWLSVLGGEDSHRDEPGKDPSRFRVRRKVRGDMVTVEQLWARWSWRRR